MTAALFLAPLSFRVFAKKTFYKYSFKCIPACCAACREGGSVQGRIQRFYSLLSFVSSEYPISSPFSLKDSDLITPPPIEMYSTVDIFVFMKPVLD